MEKVVRVCMRYSIELLLGPIINVEGNKNVQQKVSFNKVFVCFGFRAGFGSVHNLKLFIFYLFSIRFIYFSLYFISYFFQYYCSTKKQTNKLPDLFQSYIRLPVALQGSLLKGLEAH